MPTPIYHTDEDLGEPISSYCHIARAGDFLFVAGTCGIGKDNKPVGSDIAAQTTAAYENVRLLLESQGATLRHVTKFITHLTDRADVPSFYAARERYFSEHFPTGEYPPNTLLIVNGLVWPELKLEIDTWAYRPQD